MDKEPDTLDVAIKGSLEIFAEGYQYSEGIHEQLRTDHAVMSFLNNVTNDPKEKDKYFDMYKKLRQG